MSELNQSGKKQVYSDPIPKVRDFWSSGFLTLVCTKISGDILQIKVPWILPSKILICSYGSRALESEFLVTTPLNTVIPM